MKYREIRMMPVTVINVGMFGCCLTFFNRIDEEV